MILTPSARTKLSLGLETGNARLRILRYRCYLWGSKIPFPLIQPAKMPMRTLVAMSTMLCLQ